MAVPRQLLEAIAKCTDAPAAGDLRKYGVDLSIAGFERYPWDTGDSMKLAWNGTRRPLVVDQRARAGDWICH